MSTEEKTAGKRLSWGDCLGVERDPSRLAGAWTSGNTRLPIWTVFENLAGGSTIQEITENFHVTDNQVRTVLAHASKMLQEEPPGQRQLSKILLDHSTPQPLVLQPQIRQAAFVVALPGPGLVAPSPP